MLAEKFLRIPPVLPSLSHLSTPCQLKSESGMVLPIWVPEVVTLVQMFEVQRCCAGSCWPVCTFACFDGGCFFSKGIFSSTSRGVVLLVTPGITQRTLAMKHT